MGKNTGALVFSIIGAIFAILGGILWATCADAIGSIGGAAGGDTTTPTIYMIVFLVLGIRGYGEKSKATFLCVLGTLMQIGNLIAQCVSVSGFSFLMSLSTILAIVLLIVATILCAKNR